VTTCDCGHEPIDHHGVDPDDGCLGVASHSLPPCPCRLTCGEAEAVANAGDPGWLRAEFERASARAATVPPHARPRLTRRES